MKIGYISTTPLPSESANSVQSIEFSKAIANKNINVDFFCPKADKKMSNKKTIFDINTFFGQELPLCFKFYNQYSLKGKYSRIITTPLIISSILFSKEYDYFFIRNPYLLLGNTFCNNSIIFEHHQWNVFRYNIINVILRYFILFAAKQRNCKLFICISEELRKRWINRGLNPQKTITAHDGVDIKSFSPVVSKEKSRKNLGLQKKGNIVTYLGSLYDNRCIPDIIWSASKLPDTLFRIIGGPIEKKIYFEKFVIKNKISNIEFIGRVSRKNVPMQLFASDVLIFTLNEKTITYDICSPMKIFEYMAAARIIVAPDLPSIREILKPTYSCLYEFPYKDGLLKSIKTALKLVKIGKADEYGKTGRKIVESKYTWDERAKNILSALKNS